MSVEHVKDEIESEQDEDTSGDASDDAAETDEPSGFVCGVGIVGVTLL